MAHDPITKADLEVALNAALDSLNKNDQYLFEVDANERAITHQLAVYLTQNALFEGWHIDCEYNRDGIVPKSLTVRQKEGNVLPDIIVHFRGKDGPNLLIIEAKKTAEKSGWDEDKVKAYIEQKNYQHGVCITFNHGKVVQKWFP